MEEIKKNSDNRGLVVAELVERRAKKNKRGETYYVLEISIRRSITEMVLELRNEKPLISANSKEPFFVFTNEGRNRFAYTLEKDCIYAFWFTKSRNAESNEEYFHIKDWRKLSSDRRSIERTLRLVLNRKEDEEEEELLTNKELLAELDRRIKNKKISFEISAVNSESNVPLELDTDLKDNESNYRVNLQKDEEEIKGK